MAGRTDQGYLEHAAKKESPFLAGSEPGWYYM
jgi:hypothetical protein